jgi:hypothetical protein
MQYDRIKAQENEPEVRAQGMSVLTKFRHSVALEQEKELAVWLIRPQAPVFF